MANVLFISLNFSEGYLLPTAPGLFTSILKQQGHEIQLFDTTHYDELSGNRFHIERERKSAYRAFEGVLPIKKERKPAKEELNHIINGFAPDVIMISLTESLYDQLTSILDYIRCYKIFTVVGGIFPTFAPEHVLNIDGVDAVCMGEGEKAVVDICDALDKGHGYKSINNICYMEDGKIIRNQLNELVDINQIPPPDFSLFEESRFYRPMAGRLYKMLPIETSRGCPYNCTFCNSPSNSNLYEVSLGQRFFRKKSIAKIKKELEFSIKNYSPEYIFFFSDTFLTFSEREFSEFIEFYSDIKLPFWMATRAETVTEDKIKRLRDVGLHRMSMGIEHGNESFRKDVLKKDISNVTIKKAVQTIHSFDMPAGMSVYNMVGFPKETPELAMDTVELNHEIAKYIDGMSSTVFIPFHGTELRRLSVQLGYLDDSVIAKESLEGDSLLNMPHFPKLRIKGIAKCFSLYSRFDKARWPEVLLAENDTDEGNKMFEKLMCEFKSMYY
ncbi:MAG: radical SAM protein [Oscillospiraceae bacterium]|nr:radical SAM protein [Oscillospiraceae bacterium]